MTSTKRLHFSKADWNGLRNYFSSVNWLPELADCVSVNQYWDKYLQIVSSGTDEFVPRFVSTRHVNVKLYPSHVRKLLSKKETNGDYIDVSKQLHYMISIDAFLICALKPSMTTPVMLKTT